MTDPSQSVREAVEEKSQWPADPEAPPADVAEQRQVVADDGEAPSSLDPDLPMEADPADAVDQQRIVTHADEEFQ